MTHTVNFTNAEGLRVVGLTEVSNETGEFMETIDLTDTHSVSFFLLKGEGKLFRLEYEQNISGTIIDAETFEGLDGAEVALLDANGNEIGMTSTDPDGSYAFANVRSGHYAVTAAMEGYKAGTLGMKVVNADLTGQNIALNHDYGIVYTEPECEEDGYWTYTCLVCDDEYIIFDLGSALGHNSIWIEYNDCKKYICQTCEKIIDVIMLDFGKAQTSANNIEKIEEGPKNIWTLKFAVEIPYADGASRIIEHTVNIEKNGNGIIDLGKYCLKYDIKGNGSNIKAFEIIPK